MIVFSPPAQPSQIIATLCRRGDKFQSYGCSGLVRWVNPPLKYDVAARYSPPAQLARVNAPSTLNKFGLVFGFVAVGIGFVSQGDIEAQPRPPDAEQGARAQ